MKQLQFANLMILSVFLAFTGCDKINDNENTAEIAVTNTYIRSAVQDFLGNDKSIFCLTSPGMCPGHFDVSPGQLTKLCKCKMLLYFDWQEAIEKSMVRVKQHGVEFYAVSALPGMCLPSSYLQTCKDTFEALLKAYPAEKDNLTKKMEAIKQRLTTLEKQIGEKITQAKLKGEKVVCSRHQELFAKSLGLDVVATFAGVDTESISNIQQSLDKTKEQTIRFVIANKQEGTALAKALADRLGGEVIVFSNFPETNYDELISANLNQLLERVQ
ncbi:MAG: zinc ABC transporter substrate-binding protein [Planctomycetes bacterium]|nr:zinc ABC transporter substrate-binding protein [Planctomycetota bacterium]